jgi:hypothetical protein
VHCTIRSHTAADYDDFFGPQHTPDAHYVFSAARLISRLPIARFIAGGISFRAFLTNWRCSPCCLMENDGAIEREEKVSVAVYSTFQIIVLCVQIAIKHRNAYKTICSSSQNKACALTSIGVFSALYQKQTVIRIFDSAVMSL